eukprot:750762-Hanusia_phi.AAC.1
MDGQRVGSYVCQHHRSWPLPLADCQGRAGRRRGPRPGGPDRVMHDVTTGRPGTDSTLLANQGQ